MNHVILSTPSNTFTYSGMVLDFEDEIIRQTGGRRVVPEYGAPRLVRRFSAPHTRYARLINLVPKREFRIEADVLWAVLMGAGDYPLLWSKSGWDRNVGKTVLYIYDTFTSRLPAIRKLLASARWDVLITGFPDAVSMLERETGRKWHAVPQGINPARFHPEPSGEPHVAFSAYGRREPRVHDAVRSLVRELGGHYDYTTTSQSLAAGTNPQDHYHVYAWHLRNSWFTFGWSVETTDPTKEHQFSPMTCRWFEAAACGTVILGDAPRDPMFPSLFGDRLVQRLNPAAGAGELRSTLMDLWERRRALREEALQLRQDRIDTWTWEARVRQMLRVAIPQIHRFPRTCLSDQAALC